MSGRITRTRLLAATTVAIAALSLTACGGTDASSVRSEATSSASTQPTPSADATDSTAQPSTKSPTAAATKSPSGSSGSSAGSTTSGGKSGGKESGSQESGGKGGESRNPQCGAGTVKTIATPVARPLNHLLITVTNTDSQYCDLLGHPYARFGEAQAVPPVDESTHPQAVVTLAPGESGYAGVLLSAADGSGTHGYSTKSLAVGFENGTVAQPSLAGKGVYVDSSLRVTYWQHSMEDALN
ncbi:DUF4232 domain-containing protein [Streptomyces sp. NPDC050848]|uniref:DUF4232 domain-containing protein n=1 Tax=Streptomyces sp. NPDC050848 TaxID=3155791 RepID=UPI0033C72B98